MDSQEKIDVLQHTISSLKHVLVQTLNYLDEVNKNRSDSLSQASRSKIFQRRLEQLLLQQQLLLLLLSQQPSEFIEMDLQEEIRLLRKMIKNLQWALLQTLNYLNAVGERFGMDSDLRELIQAAKEEIMNFQSGSPSD